ncbi:MAG: class I SAM-dependent methyltransferase [Gammaproteobacteria bacterium]
MPEQTQRDVCILCGNGSFAQAVNQARVHSNVRRWHDHWTTVWRCGSCGSLHSLERLELAPFYEAYPYSQRVLDNWTRTVFRHHLRRLKRHGLCQESRVLDYGCSQGLFVNFLRDSGIQQVVGYDPYVAEFSSADVLNEQFDLVLAQDVIEHVEDPRDLFRLLTELVRPGGLLCIGTPRADGIDLSDPEQSIHSLHTPFHCHILSEQALQGLAAEHHLLVERLYRRHIFDTLVPFVNWTFIHDYLGKLDNTLDAGFETPSMRTILTSPHLIAMGLFGYFRPIRSEMLALIRKPG